MNDPYYDDGTIRIYHGDALDLLPRLTADTIVTDPPYGIADAPLQGQGRTGKQHGISNDWHPPSDWDQSIDPAWCIAASAAAPLVAWFGHWRKRTEVEAAMAHPLHAEIVWAKDCHTGPPCPLAMRDERIWVFSRAAVVGQRFETSVWDEPIIPTWERKHHKNEKPEHLMRRLIAWLPGDLILDPFMGSGTTLRAAKDLGRPAIGVELEERYCEIAARRLGQEVLELG